MDIAKRQLLRDLEIDLWVLRPAPETLGESQLPDERLTPVVAPATPAELKSTSSTETPLPLPKRRVGKSVMTEDAETDMAVVCVSAPGVLMLLESHESPGYEKSVRRLVADLLATTVGDWQISVRETQFTWPPTGVTKLQSQDGCRALGAFVEKQLQESGARWVLATATVTDWLADGLLDDKLISMPPIQNLSADSEQKKQLWRQIQTRLT
ncbi:MAG: hypothetical protein O7F71_01350 [Gammaproteobacteria bacterium]|nr:hypothetical protein [Gammaproteobacteria bacterium]